MTEYRENKSLLSTVKTAFLTLILLTLCSSYGAAQTDEVLVLPNAPKFCGLIAANSGYIVENPRMIVGPTVDRASISPNGRYVIATRREEPVTEATLANKSDPPVPKVDAGATVSIVVYNAASGHSSVVWSERPDLGNTSSVRLFGWIGGTSRAILTHHTETTKPDGTIENYSGALFVDVERGTVREAPLSSYSDGYVGLDPSPTAPYAALLNAEGGADKTVRFLKSDGALTDPIKIPTFLWFTRWSDDGSELRGSGSQTAADGSVTDVWYAVNPATGLVRQIPSPSRPSNNDDFDKDPVPPAKNPPPFRIVAKKSKKASSDTASSSPLYLESRDGSERVRIAAEGTPLMATRQIALYTIAGSLYAAPIREIGRPAFARLRLDATKEAAKAQAIRLSSALREYAIKNGNVYPPADAHLRELLSLSDSDFVNFVYQPPPVRVLASRNSPYVGSIGFVKTPYGQMTLSNDGHALWEDAP